MGFSGRWAATLSVCLLGLSACHGGFRKAPTGQVVARVGGQEITVRELNLQVGGRLPSDPQARRAKLQNAVAYLVTRMALAQLAQRDKLDRGPDFALRKADVVEGLMAATAQQQLAGLVPPTTDDEARQFITDNPTLFANREILSVDAVRPRTNLSDDQVQAFKSLNQLDQVEAKLTQLGVASDHGQVQLDTAKLNPQLVGAIKKLPAGEVFITRTGGMVMFGVLLGAQSEAISGDQALATARAVAHERDIKQAGARQIAQALQASKVVYNPNYRPDALGDSRAGR